MKEIPLSGDAKFLFFTMMQAAIRMKKMGKNEKEFLNFAKGTWESLDLNDPDELFDILQDSMLADLKNFVENK